MTPKRKKLIEEFSGSVRALGKAVWQQQAACFTHYDLHPAQVRALYAINRRERASTKDLAGAFRITPSAATQLVDSLVDKGFLTRVPDPTDHRRVLLELSGKGRKRFERFRTEHFAMTTKVLQPLADTELATLIRIQRKITDGAT